MWMCAAQSTVRFKRNKDMAKEVIGKGWITVSAINDGKPGSPGSPGSPGEPGSDGYTVCATPSVIMLGIRKVSNTAYVADTTKNLRIPGECLPIDLYGCFGDDSFAIFNIKKSCSVSQNKTIIAKSSIFDRALDMISDSAITFPDLGAGHLSCPFVYIKF